MTRHDPRTPFLVLLETYHGGKSHHDRYLRSAIVDSLRRREAPVSRELIYGPIQDPKSLALYVETASDRLAESAEKLVIYYDLGVARAATLKALSFKEQSKPVEYRTLGGEWLEWFRDSRAFIPGKEFLP